MKPVTNEYSYTRLTTQTTAAVQCFTGRGVLHFVTVNLTSALTVGLRDATASATNATIGVLKASVAEGTYRYDTVVSTGLRIVPSGHAGDITVVWSQG